MDRKIKLWIGGKATEMMTLEEVRAQLEAGAITDDVTAYVEGCSYGWVPLRKHLALLDPKHAAGVVQQPSESIELPWRYEIGPMASTFGFGMFLVILGAAIILFYWLMFEQTIERVNNIGLMTDRQIGIQVGGYLFMGGMLLLSVGQGFGVRAVRKK